MIYYENILQKSDITTFIDYFRNDSVDADKIDRRPDVCSKHPQWENFSWPRSICEDVLKKVLDYNFIVEEIIFHEVNISYRVHVDSGSGNVDQLGSVIIIPLQIDGHGSTILFDNFWHGASTKFSKLPIPPFEYWLPGVDGNWVYVTDLRELLADIEQGRQIPEFDVTPKFVSEIKYLIDARSNKSISKVDHRCYDYTNIVNYDDSLTFDPDLHQQYLRHLPIENLHGLTVSDICEWVPGDCFVFDRTQLHCGGYGHTKKLGITIFTNRAD
jgi:hypothetical protein